MQMLNRLEKRNSNDLRKCELFNGKPVVGRKLTWGRCHKQNLEKHSYASLFLNFFSKVQGTYHKNFLYLHQKHEGFNDCHHQYFIQQNFYFFEKYFFCSDNDFKPVYQLPRRFQFNILDLELIASINLEHLKFKSISGLDLHFIMHFYYF